MRTSRTILAATAILGACGDAGGASETTAVTNVTGVTGATATGNMTDVEPTGGDDTGAASTAVDPTVVDPTTGAATLTTGTSESDCTDPVCSDDGTQVLCAGEIVAFCPDGLEVCQDGACVAAPPCELAEATQSSEGCDFWAVKSELIAEGDGACFAAFIANTSTQPVHITVEYQGAALPVAQFARIPAGQGQNLVYGPYDADAGLPVGEVAILFLSRGGMAFPPDCPIPAGVAAETSAKGTGRASAFHITTDLPVSAYQMLPYGGGSAAITSATLLLPTGTWGLNYIGVNAYQAGGAGFPLLAIVAEEDATTVTLDPTVDVIAGNNVAGGPAGVPIAYMLGRGEVLQISQANELTGSPIAADKPIGVFGGSTCMNVPTSTYACDGAHQQIPPVNALGSSYTAVRYRSRNGADEAPPWRIVGAVDGTQLTWIPAAPPGAPTAIQLGEVREFAAAGPFVVSSQDENHPFYLAGYMTGGDPFGAIGDPEFVNVVPTAQYLEKYVFFTDPTYPETSLVVVRTRKDGAFADVTLGCAGVLAGWQPIGDSEYTRVDLVTGNYQSVGACANGRHELASANPVGVTVWGWGSPGTTPISEYVSYAYPAGTRVKAINDVVVPPN